MIFVTVGTQLPFLRLIDAMAALAGDLSEPVIAQAGPHSPEEAANWGSLDIRTHLAPAEFDRCFAEARVVVGHAGMGTVLSARRHGKPVILLPRRHELGEHRNDHQMATAREVARLSGVHIAWTAKEIAPLLAQDLPAPEAAQDSPEKVALVGRLRRFITEGS
ncbi:glycosyltransferase [Dinoroseobacter sp. S124A]|uniref:glycosyltransferase n=1 Tax=Dinoroseobacter sp. S124A TaxID=3415128 RepID=UPI003C7CEC05